MNTQNTEQNILDIIAELDEPTMTGQGKMGIHTIQEFESSLPRWEDRTSLDRFIDFVQTTDTADLLKLAGVALGAVGLVILSLAM